MAQPAPASKASSQVGWTPPASFAMSAAIAMPIRKTNWASIASIVRAIPRVTKPPLGAEGRPAATGSRALRRKRRLGPRSSFVSRSIAVSRRDETISSPIVNVCSAIASRTAGLDIVRFRISSNSGLLSIRSASWAVSLLSIASPRMRSVRGLASTRSTRPSPSSPCKRGVDGGVEVGARKHLANDSLDHVMLDERTCDRLGKRPGERPVDGGLGDRFEHLAGNRTRRSHHEPPGAQSEAADGRAARRFLGRPVSWDELPLLVGRAIQLNRPSATARHASHTGQP